MGPTPPFFQPQDSINLLFPGGKGHTEGNEKWENSLFVCVGEGRRGVEDDEKEEGAGGGKETQLRLGYPFLPKGQSFHFLPT